MPSPSSSSPPTVEETLASLKRRVFGGSEEDRALSCGLFGEEFEMKNAEIEDRSGLILEAGFLAAPTKSSGSSHLVVIACFARGRRLQNNTQSVLVCWLMFFVLQCTGLIMDVGLQRIMGTMIGWYLCDKPVLLAPSERPPR